MDHKIKRAMLCMTLILFMPISNTSAYVIPNTMDSFDITKPITNTNDHTNTLGNRGMEIHKILKTTTDKDSMEKLQKELNDITVELKTHAIPTIEEYEINKAYWARIAAELHISEQGDGNLTHITHSHTCTECNRVPEVRFQSGFGFGCYGGLWVCHAYAPVWERLNNIDFAGEQKLILINDHDWIDPFWLMKANKQMNVDYDYIHNIYNDGGTNKRNDLNADTQYFSSSYSLRTVDMNKFENVRKNFSIENIWTVNSMN